jgi:hypothetical protein
MCIKRLRFLKIRSETPCQSQSERCHVLARVLGVVLGKPPLPRPHFALNVSSRSFLTQLVLPAVHITADRS